MSAGKARSGRATRLRRVAGRGDTSRTAHRTSTLAHGLRVCIAQQIGAFSVELTRSPTILPGSRRPPAVGRESSSVLDQLSSWTLTARKRAVPQRHGRAANLGNGAGVLLRFGRRCVRPATRRRRGRHAPWRSPHPSRRCGRRRRRPRYRRGRGRRGCCPTACSTPPRARPGSSSPAHERVDATSWPRFPSPQSADSRLVREAGTNVLTAEPLLVVRRGR